MFVSSPYTFLKVEGTLDTEEDYDFIGFSTKLNQIFGIDPNEVGLNFPVGTITSTTAINDSNTDFYSGAGTIEFTAKDETGKNVNYCLIVLNRITAINDRDFILL